MVVTNTILNNTRADIKTSLQNTLSHIATGTGTTTPTTSDTSLVAQTLIESNFGTDSGANFFGVQMFQDTTENNGNNIAEIATFDAGSGGTMYSRSLSNVIGKDATTEVFIEVRFNIVVENG